MRGAQFRDLTASSFENCRDGPGKIRTCVTPVMSRVLLPLSYGAVEAKIPAQKLPAGAGASAGVNR